MKVYISGAITNNPDYVAQFRKAEKTLKAQGHTPLNPTWITAEMAYLDYMRIDLAMLDVAEAIYMLKGYEDSKGAQFELEYAMFHGKILMFEQQL